MYVPFTTLTCKLPATMHSSAVATPPPVAQ
jgi:hypothetical protein